MLKKTGILSLMVTFLLALPGGLAQAGTVTVATFADPSMDAGNPLFTIDLDSNSITGGWDDTKTGLSLDIPYSGHIFGDAFFTMTAVIYTADVTGGETGGGVIKFFEDDTADPETATPLIQIDFAKAHVTPFSFGATDWFYADDVTITGSEISHTLSDEAFTFSFANQAPLSGNWNKGYTATAAFTSSATPEPATIALLGLGALSLIRRKRSRQNS